MLRRFYYEEDKNYMTTGVPLAWLSEQSPGTVTLDPTVTLTPPTDDVWIEYNVSSNFNSYTQVRIGRGNGYGWKRTLIIPQRAGWSKPTNMTPIAAGASAEIMKIAAATTFSTFTISRMMPQETC
jgi:hypothetical protein